MVKGAWFLAIVAIAGVLIVPSSAIELKYQLYWSFHPKTSVSTVEISADGRIVGAVTVKDLYVIDQYGGLIWNYTHSSNIGSISLSRNGSRLAVGGAEDSSVYLYSSDGKDLQKFEARHPVSAVAVSPDGRFVAAGTITGRLLSLNSTGTLIWSRELGEVIGDVAVGEDGTVVSASGSTVRMTVLGNETWKKSFEDSTPGPVKVDMTSDGSWIAASQGRFVHLLDRDGRENWSFNAGGQTTDVAFSPEGSRIAVAAYPFGGIYLLDLAGDMLWRPEDPALEVAGNIALSQNGTDIVIGVANRVSLYKEVKPKREGSYISNLTQSFEAGDSSGADSLRGRVYIQSAGVIERLELQFSIMEIGQNYTFHIFSDKNGLPGEELARSSERTGTSGIYGKWLGFDTNVSVSPGFYWVGITLSNSTRPYSMFGLRFGSDANPYTYVLNTFGEPNPTRDILYRINPPPETRKGITVLGEPPVGREDGRCEDAICDWKWAELTIPLNRTPKHNETIRLPVKAKIGLGEPYSGMLNLWLEVNSHGGYEGWYGTWERVTVTSHTYNWYTLDIPPDIDGGALDWKMGLNKIRIRGNRDVNLNAEPISVDMIGVPQIVPSSRANGPPTIEPSPGVPQSSGTYGFGTQQPERSIVLFGDRREYATKIFLHNSGEVPYEVVLGVRGASEGLEIQIKPERLLLTPTNESPSPTLGKGVQIFFQVPTSAKEGDTFKAKIAATPSRVELERTLDYEIVVGPKDVPASRQSPLPEHLPPYPLPTTPFVPSPVYEEAYRSPPPHTPTPGSPGFELVLALAALAGVGLIYRHQR